MSGFHDEPGHGLGRWEDDDLVRALRAPGRPSELAGEERYVAAFRAAHGRGATVIALRRGIRRLGAGGTAVIVVVGLSSGVAAAAYTRNLPDPVQQVVHDVLGAPAPESDRDGVAGRERLPAPSGGPAPTQTESATQPPTSPSAGSTPGSGSTPGAAPVAQPTARPTAGPTRDPAPSAGPTPGDPTPSPTDPVPAPEPARMTVDGNTHRAAPGTSVTLSGIVSSVDGSPLPGQPVRLQVRGPQRWRHLADATADESGLVTFSTPPAVATARYRLVGGPSVHSEVWRVVLMPTVTATASHVGDAVSVTVGVVGGREGDRIALLRVGRDGLVLVNRARLDAAGGAALRAPARDRRTAYVVRLPATRAHGPGRTRLVVAPLRPASLSIGAASHEVGPGGSLAIGGVVRAADGTAVSGQVVVLQVRGPERWRALGRATSDAGGAVSLMTPVLDHTAVYRLVAGGVSSDRWRVVLVPTLQARVTTGEPAVIAVTARGGRAGDTVALLRRVDGRLVRVMRTVLSAEGTARFAVTQGPRETRYVVRLLPTNAHAAARVALTVPPG